MLDGVLTNMQQSSSPPAGTPFGMHKALVIGNGESRSWFKPCHQDIGDNTVTTWGCNALYRDGYVHNLVAVDYGIATGYFDGADDDSTGLGYAAYSLSYDTGAGVVSATYIDEMDADIVAVDETVVLSFGMSL